METLLNKNFNFNIIQIQGLLCVVNHVLERNKNNPKLLFELKTFFINFGLSFKDKTYIEVLFTNESNKKLINSIINSFENVLKYIFENSKLII